MATKKAGLKGKKNSETTVHESNKKPSLLAIKQEEFYKGPISRHMKKFLLDQQTGS